jgi:alpha-tubulin suppressor-like RCC1 family protein
MSLNNKKIVAISCGETHTLALTDSGHLYSFGANGCGQLGQFQNEYDRKRRGSFEDIVFPKIQNGFDNSYSFLSGFESSNSVNSSPRESSRDNNTSR